MSREFRIFEVDKYGNRFFVVSRNSLDSARYYLKTVLKDADVTMGASWIIQDENGDDVSG